MKLLTLYANNFKKLSFDRPLKLKDGITVISGLNEAGKSTVLDAILYALYGRVTRPPGHVKDEDLLGYGTNTATVWLEFSIGDAQYRVYREIRRNGTNKATLDELVTPTTQRPLASKSREVTAVVQRLLSDVSFDEMVCSNVVAQKDLNGLIERGAERSKVINAFLHLESFNKVTDDLNEERRDLEGTGPNRPGIIRTEQDKLDELLRDYEEFKRRREQNAGLKAEIDAANRELGTLEPQHRELEARLEQLTKYDEVSRQQQQLQEEAKNRQQILDNHRKGVSSITKEAESLGQDLLKFTDLPSPQEIQKVSDAMANVKTVTTEANAAKKSVESKAAEVTLAEEPLKGYDKQAVLKITRAKPSVRLPASGMVLSLIAALVTYLLTVPIVPWVLAAVATLFAILFARVLSRMSALVKLQEMRAKFDVYDEKQKELKRLEAESTSAESRQSSAEASLLGAVSAIERYRDLASSGSPIERAEEVLKRYNGDKVSFDEINAKLANARKTLGDLQKQLDEPTEEREIADLKRRASELSLPELPAGIVFSRVLLTEVTREKEQVATNIGGRKEKVEGNKRTIAQNEEYLSKFSDIEQRINTQTALIGARKRDLQVTKAAMEGIGKTAELRRIRFRPSVQSYMGEILPSLTSGRYKAVLLDDDFEVTVFDPEAGEFRPKDVFSGGTEDQFLLGMRLAFALALLPEAKGTALQFLWLDEPLSSSDEVRRSGIIDYINTSLSKRFGQIFVVSHVGGLEEQVPNVIRLDNGRVQG